MGQEIGHERRNLRLESRKEQAEAMNSDLVALFLSTLALSADFASQQSKKNPNQTFVSYSTITAALIQSDFTWDFQGSRVAQLSSSSNANVINDESLGSLLHKTVFDSSVITDDFLRAKQLFEKAGQMLSNFNISVFVTHRTEGVSAPLWFGPNKGLAIFDDPRFGSRVLVILN